MHRRTRTFDVVVTWIRDRLLHSSNNGSVTSYVWAQHVWSIKRRRTSTTRQKGGWLHATPETAKNITTRFTFLPPEPKAKSDEHETRLIEVLRAAHVHNCTDNYAYTKGDHKTKTFLTTNLTNCKASGFRLQHLQQHDDVGQWHHTHKRHRGPMDGVITTKHVTNTNALTTHTHNQYQQQQWPMVNTTTNVHDANTLTNHNRQH